MELEKNSSDPVKLSVVVPIHNEVSTVIELYSRLVETLSERYEPFELIFVDDNSTDGSRKVLEGLAQVDSQVTVIELRRQFGQTAALAAGFDQAHGEVVLAMDGDLQHDPTDIPVLLEKLEEGYDIVSGWRKKRVDNFWLRRLPSRLANWIMAKLSGVKLHDFGTTFKAYRRDVIEGIRLYGEMHRFIPALASANGVRIVEVPIHNIERPKGSSHYGISRAIRVFFDLITVRFLLRYITRPLHFFGPIGLATITAGMSLGGWLLFAKFVLGKELFSAHGPLLVLTSLLVIAGIQLISTGLIGELLSRTYFESQERRIYSVAKIVRGREVNEQVKNISSSSI